MKPSAITEHQVDALQEFAESYAHLLDSSRTAGGEEYGFFLEPKNSRAAWEDWLRATAIAGGRAATALERFSFEVGGVSASSWAESISHPAEVNPQHVQAAARAALGAATEQLSVERCQERTLTGVVARVIRWPQDLRATVGGTPVQQRAASAVGIGGQVIAGLAVALIIWVVGRIATLLLA